MPESARDQNSETIARYLEAIRTSPRQGTEPDPNLERAFISVAKRYAKRHRISRAAWLEMDVAAAVLSAAGIFM